MIRLHLVLSKALNLASSQDNFLSSRSFPTDSIHFLLGLPLPRFPPAEQFTSLLGSLPSSILITCPHHLSLAWLAASSTLETPRSLLMSSFEILSSHCVHLLTPPIILRTFMSATSVL